MFVPLYVGWSHKYLNIREGTPLMMNCLSNLVICITILFTVAGKEATCYPSLAIIFFYNPCLKRLSSYSGLSVNKLL